MHKSQNVEKTLSYLASLGRFEKERVVRESNLNNRELNIIQFRYIDGNTISEASDKLQMTEEAFVKAQRKAIEKLYLFIFSNKIPIFL